MEKPPPVAVRFPPHWTGIRPVRLALLFCLLFVVRVISLQRAQSPCIDELIHIPAGYVYWHWKDFYANMEHPVLVKLVSAAGFAASHETTGWIWKRDSLQSFFAGWRPELLSFHARWSMLLFSLALLALFHATVRRLFDSATAALCTLALTLSPLLVAHSVFVHTDVAASLFYLASFAVLACWAGDGRGRWLALLAAVLALGMLAKYSITLAVVNSTAAVAFLSPRGARLKTVAFFLGAFAVLFFILSWLGYGGTRGALIGDHPAWAEWIPFPNFYKQGWWAVWKHNAQGHANIFLMKPATLGHFGYFPLAFVLKTPIPVLLAMLAGARLLFARKLPWRWLWLLFASTYWLAALTSNINIGVRHLLPAVPLMWLLAAAALQTALRRSSGRWVTGLLLGWLALASFRNWGSELAYFNELAGGRSGWKYLADSNVDWGQQVAPLADFVRRSRVAPLYQDLFTNLPLSDYGIQAEPVTKAIDGMRLRPGWYAISAHALAANPTRPYDTFRLARPIRSFGNSIYLYRVQ
ncbi:MAG: glycosyltransferase family 39 protein [Acidobacteria bacterium]|nr:glycosyltransferase family 39 protein [Acidobacteriota bacterium]